MNRCFFVYLLAVLLLAPTFSALSAPEESIEKLVQSAKGIQSGNGPTIALSEEEENELIDALVSSKKKEGVALTRQQAAIMIGQVAGYMACGAGLKEAFGGGTKKKQSKPVSLPEPDMLPSGLPVYEAGDIYNAYVSNEFATKKTLAETPIVCIAGDIQKIASEEYYPDASNFASGKGKYPRVSLQNFQAYLTKPHASLASVVPGQTAFFICDNFSKGMFMTIQAECSIATSGTVDNENNFQPVYVDDELYNMLFQKKQ